MSLGNCEDCGLIKAVRATVAGPRTGLTAWSILFDKSPVFLCQDCREKWHALGIGTIGLYRIACEVQPYHASGMCRGFSQVIKLCRALQRARADYSVEWASIESGVLIAFTIARRPAKNRNRYGLTKGVMNE